MSEAKNNPVHRPKREVHTNDFQVGNAPSVNLDEERTSDIIETIDGANSSVNDSFLADQAFFEEPVTIVIQKSADKYPAPVVDCWVNGRGAEMFVNGKWAVTGWLPVGVPVITKRKYVEVLARAKTDSVQTNVVKHENHEDNIADRTTSTKYPFTVRQDSAKGHEWLARVLMEG